MPAIDLHTHTWLSPDGGLLPRHFERMFSRGSLDYVAVTDHNTIAAAQELRRQFGDRIIVGEEISTTEGDLIGLYLTDPVPKGLSTAEAVRRIHEQSGLVYVPHPFEHFRKSGGTTMLASLDGEIDILEVFNGRTVVPGHNDKASSWAHDHKLPGAASSDAHGWAGWGKTYTVLATAPTRDTLCDLLRGASLVTTPPGLRMLLYPKLNRVKHWIKGSKQGGSSS
jgi:predicted metal-dependent phosphoesterase TrpH